MKLYEVHITTTILVGAESINDAWETALSELARAIRDGGVSPVVETVREISHANGLPPEWRDSLVYHVGTSDVTARSLVMP